MKNSKLHRSKSDRKIAGVCGGLAEHFGIDATIIRIVWALSVIMLGTGFWVYVVCALLIPEEPNGKTFNNNSDGFKNDFDFDEDRPEE